MPVKQFFKKFLVPITILTLLVSSAGAAFAETINDEVNAEFIKSAFAGNMAEVARLLEKGANVNAKRPDGITALMGASLEGQQEVVEFLLTKGADVNAKENSIYGRAGGATAADLASRKGYQEIVKLLVRAGAFYEEKVELYQREKIEKPENHPAARKRD